MEKILYKRNCFVKLILGDLLRLQKHYVIKSFTSQFQKISFLAILIQAKYFRRIILLEVLHVLKIVFNFLG